jgi:hypothetical protein
MSSKLSKTNESAEFFNARIDAMPLRPDERVWAKAELARAEAFAEALSGLFGWVQRSLKSLADHTYHRPTASHS